MKLYLVTFLIFIHLSLSAQGIDVIQFVQLDKYKTNNELFKIKHNTVVFIGNSITEGWVNNMPDFFNKNNFVGRGISGQTSAQLLLRFRQDVVDLKPELVVINIGTNDVAENSGTFSENFTLDNINSMVDIAKANNIKVILSSVLPAIEFYWRPGVKNAASKIVSLNKGIKKLAEKLKLPYLDYHSILKNNIDGLDFAMANDGVHPTLACYEIMADLALNMVQKTLNK